MRDENHLRDLFFEVMNLGNISTVFQPIISLRDGSIFGYEALSRGPENTKMNSPATLFEYAENYDKVWELETLCRLKAFESCKNNNCDDNQLRRNSAKLFLNVNPNIMHDAEYKRGFTKEYIHKFSLNPENIIFEITEREAIKNMSGFKEIVQNYKNQEYQIAIDDAGAGYSGLNLISDIHPHFIKLDMHLIRDIDKDFMKQCLIKSLCDFARQTKSSLIAEGIETLEEMKQLIELGVNYGQGYFIQRPADKIYPIRDEVIKVIYDENCKKNNINRNSISDIYIANICSIQESINPNTSISNVMKRIEEDPSIQGFCIVENKKLLGVITRNDLYLKLSGPYGYSLNANKSVRNIMSQDYLCVEADTPIDKVANIAMQREYEQLYDFITVTKEGKYYGIVTVKDLLEKSVQIEVIHAKHLNPLSELPGNLIIQIHLEKCISSKGDYCVMYLDLDNFKAYNDTYSFERGDEVLKKLTQIIKHNIPKDEFIGHIGGDDFIAIISHSDVESLCENILHDFAQAVPKFYNKEDLERGYIIAKNRYGKEEKFPPLSLSIAVVRKDTYNDIYELTEKSSRIKKECKTRGGNCYMVV